MSELVREALRRYEKERRREIIDEARRHASVLGIKEEEVPGIVKEWRREQREEKNRPKARSSIDKECAWRVSWNRL